jgi:hypothetical protein
VPEEPSVNVLVKLWALYPVKRQAALDQGQVEIHGWFVVESGMARRVTRPPLINGKQFVNYQRVALPRSFHEWVGAARQAYPRW